jgi:hypothetical protein
MVSSYMNEITHLTTLRDTEAQHARLTLENFYTMEGSALQGTMIGGALNPRLSVELNASASDDDIEELVADAVASSPVNGLLTNELGSQFTLYHNGEAVPVGRVEPLAASPQPDPGDQFERAELAEVSVAPDLMVRLRPASQVQGLPGGVNSSLQESQSRTLHVRATCVEGDDGVKNIVENLISPIGSEFGFRSNEVPPFGGAVLAPDAVTYLSAGIGFCFMTQFGRYARITRKQLDEYRIVQDTHFYPGDGKQLGRMDAVETHVYLVSPEDVEFSRRTLDMGEQTCFLHATCRTQLGIEVKCRPGGRRRPIPTRCADRPRRHPTPSLDLLRDETQLPQPSRDILVVNESGELTPLPEPAYASHLARFVNPRTPSRSASTVGRIHVSLPGSTPGAPRTGPGHRARPQC